MPRFQRVTPGSWDEKLRYIPPPEKVMALLAAGYTADDVRERWGRPPSDLLTTRKPPTRRRPSSSGQ